MQEEFERELMRCPEYDIPDVIRYSPGPFSRSEKRIITNLVSLARQHRQLPRARLPFPPPISPQKHPLTTIITTTDP